MRAAIYVRVSTEHKEQKLSPEHQLAECREYAEQHGMETSDDLVYNDAGLSGTEMENRPDVQRLLLDARAGKFDAVLFTAISRFARDMADALSLKKKLETMYGIRIVSIEEGYDTAIEGRNSEMLFSVHAMLAAHKSQEMSKAIRRGLRQSAKRGRHIGNITPFGYTKTEDKRLVPDPKTAPIVRLIYRLYMDGLGSKAIAEELNRRGIPTYRGKLWAASTITNVLRNPVYKGTLVAGRWRVAVDIELSRQFDIKIKRQKQRNPGEWIIVENAHEPIVDEDTWNAVQQRLTLKARNKGIKRTANILAGLMQCAVCGSAMIVKGREQYTYVKCSTRIRIGNQACSNPVHMRYSAVLDAVLAPLRHFDDPHALDRVVGLLVQSAHIMDISNRLSDLQRQLEHNQERERRAVEAYTAGVLTLDMLRRHVEDLHAEADRLRAEMDELKRRQIEIEQIESKRDELREMLSVINNYDQYDPITVRHALGALIDRVIIGPDEIKVMYKWDAQQVDQLTTSLMS
ncbi:MAG: recombinase family protein [Alicyclobacillus sp.]|nr:recombinase family protein [Alicyclobacillus sp.]